MLLDGKMKCNMINWNFFLCVSLCEIQTDLEEAKAQEIAKFQDALHEMQLQVEEANARVIKEQEAARKAIEEAPPVIKETPVIVQDTEKIDLLTAEVESLKVDSLSWMMVNSMLIFTSSFDFFIYYIIIC